MVTITISEIQSIELNKYVIKIAESLERNAVKKNRDVTQDEDLQLSMLANIHAQIMVAANKFEQSELDKQKADASNSFRQRSEILKKNN